MTSTIFYDWEYTVESIPPWNGTVSQPSELSQEYNNVSFCVGYDRAKEIFNNSNKTSKTIVYVAVNTPKDYECDMVDYPINFLMIKWSDKTDPDIALYDHVISNSNIGIHQCITQEVKSYSWFPRKETYADSLFRPWTVATADFICAASC